MSYLERRRVVASVLTIAVDTLWKRSDSDCEIVRLEASRCANLLLKRLPVFSLHIWTIAILVDVCSHGASLLSRGIPELLGRAT